VATVSHELAPEYRPRRPRASPLYQLIERHYPDFERSYDERYERRYVSPADRPICNWSSTQNI